MGLHNYTLISFGHFDKGFLKELARSVNRELLLPVNIRTEYIDLTDYFDPARRQYDANRLLKLLESEFSDSSVKTIGLFNIDLFIPILTFIFGQAFLNGRTAIASVYRLSNELYGMKKDDDLTIRRFKKEIIHELGHTMGLIHCHVPLCVMRSATYLEDIDQKEESFCSSCRENIEKKLGL
jgi:archaemetzincin